FYYCKIYSSHKMIWQSTVSQADPSANLNSGISVTAPLPSSKINDQSFDDPFGDGPFKAFPTVDSSAPAQQHTSASPPPFDTTSSHVQDAAPSYVAAPEFGSTFYDSSTSTTQFAQKELLPTPNNEIDILADILPPT
ncbi:hypothetical protein M569_06401, partial [Genlisea aurea]